MVYNFWSIAPTNLPARSRLYSLAPKGIGTAQVESLTSYVTRLADAHAVSPGTLTRQEIFPSLPTSPKHFRCATLHSLNGLGPYFMQWVMALQELTSRNDLESLTLLPWRSVFAADGILRRHRTWCPRCYEERRSQDGGVYDSLLWALASVTACPVHEVLLEERCPCCKRRPLPLSARGLAGVCNHCGTWLGTNASGPLRAKEGRDLVFRVQVAREVGVLLSSNISQNRPTLFHLRNNIHRAIEDWADGNRLLLCRIARISDKSLTEWLSGAHRPSLPLLIVVTRNLRIPLSRFLIEQISVSDEVWIQAREAVRAERSKLMKRWEISRREPDYPMTRTRLWALSPGDREAAKAEIKASMEATLEMDVPRSVRDIFRSLGYRQCTMGQYWFPELTAAIQAKRKRRFDRCEVELKKALAEIPPPTVAEVAERLGIRLHSLRRACPELCTRLSSCRFDRRQFQFATVGKALKRALNEAPVSFPQLASRLGCNASTLRVTHKDLHRRLHQRYLAHRSSERQEIELRYQEQVSLAIQEITSGGKYPSSKRVLSTISNRSPSLTSVHFTNRALKQVRGKLAEAAQAVAVP